MNNSSNTKRSIPMLSQRIRSARRSAGLSQAALAQRAVVTASAVAQWEHPNGTRPSLGRLEAIAKATGTSVEWLISGGHRPRSKSLQHTDIEVPALAIELYAESAEEEELLQCFRVLSPRIRGHIVELVDELSARRNRRGEKRR